MAGYRNYLSSLVFVAMLVPIAVSYAQANRCDALNWALSHKTHNIGADYNYEIAVKLFWFGTSKPVKYWSKIRKLPGACEDPKAIKAWYWLAKHCFRPNQGRLYDSMRVDLIDFGSSCAEQIDKYGGNGKKARALIGRRPVY